MDTTTIMHVPLSQIRWNDNTQARARLDPELIAEYSTAMREGTVFPPVVLFRQGERYWVGDGHHRCQAARWANCETIPAEVREGGPRDAFLYACSANASHGLRRTNADKRHMVSRLLKDQEWSRWSSREIGRQCEVSHTFVDQLRQERAAGRTSDVDVLTGNSATEVMFTTRHGTVATMDVSRIGGPRGVPEVVTPRVITLAPAPEASTPPVAGPVMIPTAEPGPESADVPPEHPWSCLTAGMQQLLRAFGQSGGLGPLLVRWTAEERAAALDQVTQLQVQLDCLYVALTGRGGSAPPREAGDGTRYVMTKLDKLVGKGMEDHGRTP